MTHPISAARFTRTVANIAAYPVGTHLFLDVQGHGVELYHPGECAWTFYLLAEDESAMPVRVIQIVPGVYRRHEVLRFTPDGTLLAGEANDPQAAVSLALETLIGE